MNQFALFMSFWILGIVALLAGLYLWYTHLKAKQRGKALEDPPPKPKMIQYHKLD